MPALLTRTSFERLGYAIAQLGEILELRDVAADRQGRAAGRGDPLGERLEPVEPSCRDHHPSSGPRETQGRELAEPTTPR